MKLEETLRMRARTEETPLPPGFEDRLKDKLDSLPAQARPTRHVGRTVLVAAAVCALCIASALALSPTLRQMLEAVQGKYTDYAKPVEASAVENGIEIRIISALADHTKIQVYAEARDLEGDRLSGALDVIGVIQPETFREGSGLSSCTHEARCVGYDPETGTALLEFTTWGLIPGEDTRLELVVPYLAAGSEGLSEESWRIPFDPERQEVRSIALSGTVNGLPLERLELSPLGAALYTRKGSYDGDLAVHLSDGTVLHPEREGGGATNGMEGPVSRYWSFAEPVDPAEITGISLQYWFIPLDADDTAAPGRWLSELPA
ncbi:hypothetical protein B5G43_06305 [Flavonifractor sp. An92]|uniref:DUF4179 domain-containing protein n=1 Tax=Flavonifractor sp. An92 TaxID=1965666 RepID=UPI000B385C1D|nr:DUF4179 domain-containing protein [Flavonifractor sp. An92]OUN07214.1 hypothetical protein B5G43_06305 [Flavonifractor sp. An92]